MASSKKSAKSKKAAKKKVAAEKPAVEKDPDTPPEDPVEESPSTLPQASADLPDGDGGEISSRAEGFLMRVLESYFGDKSASALEKVKEAVSKGVQCVISDGEEDNVTFQVDVTDVPFAVFDTSQDVELKRGQHLNLSRRLCEAKLYPSG